MLLLCLNDQVSLEELKFLNESVSLQGIFSEKDVDVNDLGLGLSHYWLGKKFLTLPFSTPMDPKLRKSHLESSLIYFKRFIFKLIERISTREEKIERDKYRN